jgi:hypothetical protein
MENVQKIKVQGRKGVVDMTAVLAHMNFNNIM